MPDRTDPEGALFLLALPHIPPPLSGTAEGEFRLWVSGIEYQGLIDLYYEDGEYVVVLDYKSSKNPKKHGLHTKEAMLQDPQCLIYAVKGLVASGKDQVKLKWLYLKCEGKKACIPVEFVLTKAEVTEAFGRIVHPKAKKIVQLKKKYPRVKADTEEERIRLSTERLLTFEPNEASCYQYGPCKFLGLCSGNTKEDKDMEDLFAELQKEMGAEPAKGVNPPEGKKEPGPKTEAMPAKDFSSAVPGQVERTADAVVPSKRHAVANLLRAIADVVE